MDQRLARLLDYRNEDVIYRFTEMYAIEEAEAESIFTETRKFLFICRMPGIFIPDDLLILDEMWHNFILFTKEYQRFCDHHFETYLHHLPSSKKEKIFQKQKNKSDPENAAAEFNKKMKVLLSTTYDVLGDDTVIRWFRDYPEQYSKQSISALRKY